MVQLNHAIIRAISFDLDDTLYLNGNIIEQAEQALSHWLQEHVAQPALTHINWEQIKKDMLSAAPLLKHDLGELRFRTIMTGLTQIGLDEHKAREYAQKAMTFFVVERSKVNISPQTHQLLEKLQSKYPLVAITNGNLDLQQAGIAHYFKFIYKANLKFPKKPHPHMFRSACHDLDIEPEQLLHIGDNVNDDIGGAHRAGCQAAWLPLKTTPPTLDNSIWQLNTLDDLLCLVD